jgi:penicillin amidase
MTGKIMKKRYGKGSYIETYHSKGDFAQELIPYDELPHLINPDRGYIVTTNNVAIDETYMHNINAAWIMDARSRSMELAIVDHISSGKKIDQKFIIDKLFNNVYDPYCPDLIKFMTGILKQDKAVWARVNSDSLHQTLFGFDCHMKGESKGALLFNVIENEFYHVLNYEFQKANLKYKYIERHVLNAEERVNYLILKLKEYTEDPKLCSAEYEMTCSSLVENVFKNGIDYIRNRLGSDESTWQWRNVNIKHYPHKPFTFIPGLKQLSEHTYKSDVSDSINIREIVGHRRCPPGILIARTMLV